MEALWVAKALPFLQTKTKTLVRLRECAHWFEYSVYAHANLNLMLDTGVVIKRGPYHTRVRDQLK